jgi:putative ABC transport system permease protein
MMTMATARALGLTGPPLVALVSTSRMPTVEEQDRLQAALGNGFNVQVERAPQPNTMALMVLAIVAGVITLGAAAIATGFAAAGLGTSTAVLFALNQRYAGIWPAPRPYPIAVPWRNVGIALLVVLLIAML